MRLKFRPKLNGIGMKGMTSYATYVQDLNNPVGVTSVPVLKGYSGGVVCVCVCVPVSLCVCVCFLFSGIGLVFPSVSFNSFAF